MNYKINNNYIEVNNPITCEGDVMELIGACISNDISLLLLTQGVLTEEFMNLKNGLAGIVLQKFMNYHIRVSAVIEGELEGRFKELAYELNKGKDFRIFNSYKHAESFILNI